MCIDHGFFLFFFGIQPVWSVYMHVREAMHVWSHWSAIACKGTLINNAMYGQSAATTDWSAIHLPGVLHSPPNIAGTLCILSKLCKLCTLHTLCILCKLYIVHCAHCGKNRQMREEKGWNQLSYGTSLHI